MQPDTMKRFGLLVMMWLVPFGVFKFGVWAMEGVSGRVPSGEPLNVRFRGYELDEVETYWRAIAAERGAEELEAEKRFLEADLVFPFAYGGALAASLLIGWVLVGRRFARVWCLLPVGVAVLADWVENLVHIRQLKLFVDHQPLGKTSIEVASLATQVKLTATLVCIVFVFGLTVWVIAARFRSRSA